VDFLQGIRRIRSVQKRAAAPAAFAAALRSARARNTGLRRAFWAGPAVFEKKKAEYSTFEAAEQLL
jgi:hypothetical protein